MAKKQLFRLTEQDVKAVMNTVLRRVLKEGSIETSDGQSWNDLRDMIGADKMLEAVWNYLDSDQIQDLIQYIRKEYDMDYYDEEEETDDWYQDDEEREY